MVVCGCTSNDEPRGGTMAMNMKQFLFRYFSQLHFDSMPEPKLRQFDSYVAKNDFRGDMKWWADNLLKKNADGKPYKNIDERPDGHYVHNDLPDGTYGETQMSDEDWSDLYSILHKAFVAMNSDKKSFANDKDDERDGEAAIKFMNEYFGNDNTKIFSLPKLSDDIKNSIFEMLGNVLKDEELKLLIKMPKEIVDVFNKHDMAALDKPKIRDILNDYVNDLARESYYADDESVRQKLADLDLRPISAALSQKKEPTPSDIRKLQTVLPRILKDLYKKPKVANIFKQYDDNKITGQIDAAKGHTDYDGKTKEKDYIKPKYEDKLDWKEKIKKTTNDFYDDVLKKFVTGHRDHIYVKETAKAIGGVLTSLKINPNDGLDAILNKEKDIIEKLQDKQPLAAVDHFKWFVAQIKELKNNGMGKAVAGALRDGDKMNAVVENMAWNAIPQKTNGESTGKAKIEEAKTAMEVMKVMQQPFFSGRALDAVRKTDFVFLSDPGASFNKSNPYIGSITKIFDKTLGWGIKGMALAGTGIASLYNRRNLGFDKMGRLEQGHQDLMKQKELAREQVEENNLRDATKIENAYKVRESTGIKDAAQLERKEKSVKRAKKKLEQMGQDCQSVENVVNNYKQIINDFNEYNKLETQHVAVGNEIKTLRQNLEGMPGQPANQLEAKNAETAKAEFDAKIKESREIADKKDAIINKYGSLATLQAKHTMAQALLPTAESEFASKTNDYEKFARRIEKTQGKIDTFKTAESEMDFLTNEITKRNDEFSHWDENNADYYYELMGFWDFLQTGSTKKLFRLSTKKAQKYMDGKEQGKPQTRMEEALSEFMRDHGYAP